MGSRFSLHALITVQRIANRKFVCMSEKPGVYLSGWEKIATFLSVSTATAKRWHKRCPMAISRAPGGAPWDTPVISIGDLKEWIELKKENRQENQAAE